MYIIPDSTVQYFKNLNLSPGYENTCYFASKATKDAAFNGMVAAGLT